LQIKKKVNLNNHLSSHRTRVIFEKVNGFVPKKLRNILIFLAYYDIIKSNRILAGGKN